jgi:FemAB-related protein (PEP-CTERM system-associated)
MASTSTTMSVRLWTPTVPANHQAAWRDFVSRAGLPGIHCDPRWVEALGEGFRHRTYALEARQDGRVVGVLPLAYVKSLLFGRFLVSLPYVSWAGVIAEDEVVAGALIDRAVELADELDVRYLELRHEVQREHPALSRRMTSKVSMRLGLASSCESVWGELKPVVRTQVRKGEKQGLTVDWGGRELLGDFYRVFSHNMRDLGTPVFSRSFFQSILTHFAHEAELCVVRLSGKAVAAALAVHSRGITEVPSVSTLRAYRSTAANSFMYWRLIQRAVERGQTIFDFGRSTVDSSTFAFKKKWGARPEPLVWQYYLRKGKATDMRPEGGKYDRMIAIWRRLPVGVTRVIGPAIVRGIPS